ncbi:kinase-like domain-containing protein [Rhizophagus clarus]|uniref:Kinase-like domain-containing protein n=1 Tax=Rhizophagus clarus TaxID=94130 RepID=A0A8H3R7F0_9GLOM|nr:kinase-like domain-containing protein [Rhizophagus clarus]
MNEIKRAHEFYGITRDLKANYIMVYKYHKICETCNFKCNAKRFQQNFENWTSGNDDIDKYIRDIQSTCHTEYETSKTLEWIPYDRLYDIQYIAKSKFNKIYRAKWIDGCIDEWDNKIKNWKRYNDNMVVITVHCKVYGITQDPITKEYMIALNEICKKCKLVCYAKYFQQNFENWTSALERIPYNRFYDNKFIAQGGFAKNKSKYVCNSKNITLDFMNEITSHFKVNLNKCIIKLYGITQDPVTKNYVMVLDFAENGNLRNYLNLCYNKLSWNDKFNYLHSIAHGIRDIHEKELIHRDLHIVISGLPPYSDVSHDDNLAIKICKGLRPRFKIKVPQLIVRLIKRCLDANQLNRPKAEELKEILSQWFRESSNKFFNCTIIQNQIKEAENINYNLSASNTFSTNLGILYETHSEAIYTSRLFNFNNLPEPKNSDDYYEENDNIISIKSSASLSLSLQIDIRQLNINNDDVNSEYRSKERI